MSNAPNTLMGEAARAFLRHVVSTYYCDATRVHEDGATFIWQRTFHRALLHYRDAVLRRGYAMRKLYANRLYTNLTGVVPDADRDKYTSLVTIATDGQSTLTPSFTQAITNADAAAIAAYQAQLVGGGRGHVARGRGGQGRGVAHGGQGRGRARRGRGRGRGRP